MNKEQRLYKIKRKSIRDLLNQLQQTNQLSQLTQNSKNSNHSHWNAHGLRSSQSDIKIQFKSAWRASGSGYANDQFHKIGLLSNKMLSSWELQRIPLAQRSCKAPKDFKGFKNGLSTRQFSRPPYTVPLKIQQQLSSSRKNLILVDNIKTQQLGNREVDQQHKTTQKKSKPMIMKTQSESNLSYLQNLKSKSSSSWKFHRAKDTLFGFKTDYKYGNTLNRKSNHYNKANDNNKISNRSRIVG